MRACKFYRIMYVMLMFVGAYMSVSAIWTISDILTGAMAIPNIIALFALCKVVVRETNEYFRTHP